MTRYLTPEFVQNINCKFSKGGIRDINAVRSAVMECQAGAFGQEFHPTLQEKAATLLRGISRNHGFVDGNKRTALVAMDIFLELNGKVLNVDQDELTSFVVSVAKGDLELDVIAKQIEAWSVSISRQSGRDGIGLS